MHYTFLCAQYATRCVTRDNMSWMFSGHEHEHAFAGEAPEFLTRDEAFSITAFHGNGWT